VKNICNDIGQNIVVKLSGSDSLIFCRELNFSWGKYHVQNVAGGKKKVAIILHETVKQLVHVFGRVKHVMH